MTLGWGLGGVYKNSDLKTNSKIIRLCFFEVTLFVHRVSPPSASGQKALPIKVI
jgi:hypothetical protein